MQLTRLIFTPDEMLEEKRITDVLDEEVLDSNFWTYWRTMFAFYNCNSALEVNLLMTEVTSLYLPCGRTTLLSVFHIRLFA